MYRVGIDLGGTNIVFGIVTDEGEILRKTSVPAEADKHTGDELVEIMAQGVKSIIEESGMPVSELRSIGIGTPGISNSKKGMLIYTVNLPFKNTDFKTTFSKYFDVPLYLNNDANCAALGELVAGGAKGHDSCVLITLGTGVGGGIVVDGKILNGFNNAAGELGHMVTQKGGELCNCGRRGCFERYASATAIINATKLAAKFHPESIINKLCDGDYSKINAKTAFDAARENDIIGKEVVETYIRDLGEGVINFINIFQPEVLLIGGGVSNEGENLLAPLREYVYKYTYANEYIPQTQIVRATLKNDAGLIGAAMLDE